MLILRKITANLLIAIIFIMLIGSTSPIYAEDIYPLEDGEKLIEKTMIDKNHVEIFTQLDEDFYLKKLQRNEGQWMVESTEAVYPKWTGLEMNKIDEKGDRLLAKALESEIESYGLEAAALPLIKDYSNSEYLPPIGDQEENSCVGWSTGYYLRTYQEAKDIGWEVKAAGNKINSHVFSPTFVYNQIRQGGVGVDGGAYIDDAGDLLKSIGAATLENFPYVPGDFNTLPDLAAIQSAEPHKISEWRLLFSNLDSAQYIVQKTKEYLNMEDLVVVGSKIGLKFQNPYIDNFGNSIITREYYPPYMHAYVIVGYDDTLITPDGVGAFKLVNSWGQDWGNEGFSYISYQAFAPNAMEGYVFTDIVNVQSQELAVDINESVVFNISFSGTGRFDIKIKNINNQLIYAESNLQGNPGINSLVWSGKDMDGNVAAAGNYKLNIIPYRGDAAKPTFSKSFTKAGKVVGASARAYIYENDVQYVSIPITFKEDGIMNIKVSYDGTVYDIISDQAVKSTDDNAYKILKSAFDFNNKDLSKLKIIIEIQ